VIKVIENASIRQVIGLYYFLLVVCSNNDSIWYLFRDITTFTVHVTGYDLEKSYVFKKIVEITTHVRFPIHV